MTKHLTLLTPCFSAAAFHSPAQATFAALNSGVGRGEQGGDGVANPAPRHACARQRGAAHRKRVVFGRDCERILLRLRLRLGLVPEVLIEHREILGHSACQKVLVGASRRSIIPGSILVSWSIRSTLLDKAPVFRARPSVTTLSSSISAFGSREAHQPIWECRENSLGWRRTGAWLVSGATRRVGHECAGRRHGHQDRLHLLVGAV
jgi:hypothetical protein